MLLPCGPAAFAMSFKHNPTLCAECVVNTVTSIPESSKNNYIYIAIDWQLIGLWG